MTTTLSHRGPDGTACSVRNAVGLGAARLSVIDLEHGAQPMTCEDGTIRVVFNGEIYNHATLRRDLTTRGVSFRTQCDTEVILQLYRAYGLRFVDHLDGMFAIAVADRDTLLLVRDRLGVKPLYYTVADGDRSFRFASEIKALLQSPDVPAQIDLQALADNVALGYPTGSRTFLDGIRSCPPGHWMRVTARREQIHLDLCCYYRLEIAPDESMDFEDAQRGLAACLTSAIESHLAADVDIGVALSGGLDSSLLALASSRDDGPPRFAYSIADRRDHPDLRQSSAVSRRAPCTMNTTVIDFAQYLAAVPAIVLAEEQPVSLFAAPMHLVCRRASNQLKVLLSGEGADELFGGYPEFVNPRSTMAAAHAGLARLERLGLSASSEATAILDALFATRGYDEYLAWCFGTQMREQLVHRHLEIADKHAMAAGVECRVPYMDRQLVEFSVRIPYRFKVDPVLGIQKYVLKHIALELFGAAITGPVLRAKIGMPSATHGHLRRLSQLCRRKLPIDYVARHELGACFEDPLRLLLFDLFRELFIQRRGIMGEEPLKAWDATALDGSRL